MKLTPAHFIWPLLALGAGAVLYIAASAMFKPGEARYANFAAGEMAQFRFAEAALAAPTTPLLNEDGAATRLADFEGEIILVNYWATWCAPCLSELPSLNRLQTDLAAAPFKVLAVSIDTDPLEQSVAFLNSKKVAAEKLTFLHDPRMAHFTSARVANAVPASILYDRQGRELGRIYGDVAWDSPEAKRIIEAAVESRIAPPQA